MHMQAYMFTYAYIFAYAYIHINLYIYVCVFYSHIYVCKQVGTEWDDDPQLAPFLTCWNHHSSMFLSKPFSVVVGFMRQFAINQLVVDYHPVR